MRRTLSIIIAVILTASSLCSCNGKKKYTAGDMTVFDTQTVIIGYDVSESAFKKKADAIIDELKRLHKLYDIYYEYEGISNIKTVNSMAGIAPVEVDGDIIGLLEYCKEIYDLTGGYTNVAMGSVLRLWHDCRTAASIDPTEAKLPSENELKEAAEHTDINNVVIDREASTVYLADERMSLDVGAVAKGYATELAARLIEENGWDSYALSVGGNVRTVGLKPDGSAWEIGVQNPDLDSEDAYFCTAMLTGGKALVTSGSYQRYYTVDGVRYHHIIHPETLRPENEYLSVTVLCNDSGMGDGLSTALFNMSEECGRSLLKEIGADAAWVYANGEIVYTEGFK